MSEGDKPPVDLDPAKPRIPSDDDNDDADGAGAHADPSPAAAGPPGLPLAQRLEKQRQEKRLHEIIKREGVEAQEMARALFLLLNGDLHTSNDEGEAELLNDKYAVTYWEAKDDRSKLLLLQHMANQVEEQIPNESEVTKNWVLAMRLLSHRAGMYPLTEADLDPFLRYHEAYPILPEESPYTMERVPEWFKPELAVKIRPHFMNIVSLVAYVFRVKGHHYTDDIEVTYLEKAQKLRSMLEGLVPDGMWQHIATYGLHAVPPMQLDKMWKDAVELGQCHRSLALRYWTPAAGTAVYFSIHAGLHEFLTLFPEQAQMHEEAIAKLRQVVADLLKPENRWKGGVNRKLYGGQYMKSMENEFSALAAAIQGINMPSMAGVDQKTDLAKSGSLNRVAKGSALTRKVWSAAVSGMIDYIASTTGSQEIGEKAARGILFSEAKGEG